MFEKQAKQVATTRKNNIAALTSDEALHHDRLQGARRRTNH